MTVDERGSRAAAELDRRVRAGLDPARSLQDLYERTGYRARSSKRRPVAMAVAFAAVVAVVGVLVLVGVWSSGPTTPGHEHPRRLPVANSTTTPPTTPTTQAAACVSPCITLHILRADNHEPFPPSTTNSGALVRICPVATCPDQGNGPGVVFPRANASGDVHVQGLDPSVEYDFNAMMVNMPGWACPGYTDPSTGDKYWFPPAPADAPTRPDVTGTPPALDGTTFYISDNCG